MDANKDNPNGGINHGSTYPSSLTFSVFISRFCPTHPPFTLLHPHPESATPTSSNHPFIHPSIHLPVHLSIQPPKQHRAPGCLPSRPRPKQAAYFCSHSSKRCNKRGCIIPGIITSRRLTFTARLSVSGEKHHEENRAPQRKRANETFQLV